MLLLTLVYLHRSPITHNRYPLRIRTCISGAINSVAGFSDSRNEIIVLQAGGDVRNSALVCYCILSRFSAVISLPDQVFFVVEVPQGQIFIFRWLLAH
jgi:hypothetical protein